MMKKFLAALLTVVMIMSLSFVTALASEEEIPATDPYAHTEHTDWESWTSTNSLPDSAGYYYLSSDVTLSDDWDVPSGETVLCLNGHDINLHGSNNISVGESSNLAICDCSQDNTNGYIDENEQIWKPGTNDGSEQYALTGGVIYGASENGAISVNRGTLTLSGGNIAGNKGGVRVFNGSFYMYGGSVCGNNAADHFLYNFGGGLYLSQSTATMFGGNISNNTADSGGGVTVATNSSFTLNGGSVSYNTALDSISGYTRGGGGFFVRNSGTLTVNGGRIEYNKASIGSGIMTEGLTSYAMAYVNLYGGSIQYNRSTSNDGAVYISGFNFVTKLSIKGNPVVDNNMSGNGEEVNVDFYQTTLIKFYIEGTLTAGANIGFSSHNAQPSNYVFTDGWSEYEHEVDLSIFTEDTERFDEIVQKNNELILHRHSLNKDYDYSQEGSIRIYCINCGLEAILSTDMLDSYTYDGQPKSANLVAYDGWNEMIELGLVDGTAEFTYFDIANYDPYAPDFNPEDPAQLPIELDSAPTNVGKYWVIVDLPYDYRKFSFEHTFTIEPATPELSISAVPDKLSGGGKIELTVSGAPDGSAISVSCSDTGVVITEENGKFYAELPNSTKDYIFTATSTATDNFTSGAAECTVEVTNKSDPIIINPPKPIEPGDDDGNNSDDELDDVVPPMLNGDDHFAYVIGYEDGTVRPDGSITRAEVATIIFRLLDGEVRDGNLTTVNDFTDVNEGDWYNTAISTLVKLGIINGRTATTFDPNAPITRAEFATLFARFDESGIEPDSDFKDIATHWAREYIERAAALGWINGYEDGTFRPDNKITRAEAMTMINRVLNREPEDEGDLLPDMRVWSDNQPGTWYYLAVQEATNSHDYTRPNAPYEHWTEITDDLDWERYQ